MTPVNDGPRDLASRTLALAGDVPVQVTVTRKSTASRAFTVAGSEEPAVSDALEVHMLVLRDGHPGVAASPEA